MSDYTRQQIIDDAKDEADGASSSRWSDTYITRRLDMVFAEEWRKILAANPTYRWALRTPTASASAQIPYTNLDNGTGDTTERFSKVLAVARDDTPYEESRFEDHPLLTLSGTGGAARVWWNEGDHIALPTSDASVTMRVWVNHTPQKPSALSGPGVIVPFPRDYSGILIYELAARLLSKGGAETDLGLELKAIAGGLRLEMLDEIARRSTRPSFVRATDTPEEWGAR